MWVRLVLYYAHKSEWAWGSKWASLITIHSCQYVLDSVFNFTAVQRSDFFPFFFGSGRLYLLSWNMTYLGTSGYCRWCEARRNNPVRYYRSPMPFLFAMIPRATNSLELYLVSRIPSFHYHGWSFVEAVILSMSLWKMGWGGLGLGRLCTQVQPVGFSEAD